jgi:hypothetical protein
MKRCSFCSECKLVGAAERTRQSRSKTKLEMLERFKQTAASDRPRVVGPCASE